MTTEIYSLDRKKLPALLDALIRAHSVTAPVERTDHVEFAEIEKGTEAVLDMRLAREAPKKVFFPQSETLFYFSGDGERREPQGDHKGEIVRPDDPEHAKRLPDQVFVDARGNVLQVVAHHERGDAGGHFDHLDAASGFPA